MDLKELNTMEPGRVPYSVLTLALVNAIDRMAVSIAEANDHLKKIANPLLGIDALDPGKITIREPYATLRDQLAMAALSGLLADPSSSGPKGSAQAAYEYADAMIDARKK